MLRALCDASQLPRGHSELLITVLISSSFLPPKYLGHVEVEESRGMHVCEDAVKKLKAVSGADAGRGWSGRRQPSSGPVFSPPHQMGRKSVKSVLWVSADGLRVVDDKTKVGGPWGWERAPKGPSPHPARWGRGCFPTHC